MLVTCDQCYEFFEVSENSIIERTISADVKEKYFECPTCSRHYTVMISDEEMRSIILRRRTIQTLVKSKYKGTKNLKQIKKLMAEDNELKKFLEKRQKELKERYSLWLHN